MVKVVLEAFKQMLGAFENSDGIVKNSFWITILLKMVYDHFLSSNHLLNARDALKYGLLTLQQQLKTRTPWLIFFKKLKNLGTKHSLL